MRPIIPGGKRARNELNPDEQPKQRPAFRGADTDLPTHQSPESSGPEKERSIIGQFNAGLLTIGAAEQQLAQVALDTTAAAKPRPEPQAPRMTAAQIIQQVNTGLLTHSRAEELLDALLPPAEHVHVHEEAPRIDPDSREAQELAAAIEASTTQLDAPPEASQHQAPTLPAAQERPSETKNPNLSPPPELTGLDDEQLTAMAIAASLGQEVHLPLPGTALVHGHPPKAARDAKNQAIGTSAVIGIEDAFMRMAKLHMNRTSPNPATQRLVDTFYSKLEAPLRHSADSVGLTHFSARFFQSAVEHGAWDTPMKILAESDRAPELVLLPKGLACAPRVPVDTGIVQLVDPAGGKANLSNLASGIFVEIVYTGDQPPELVLPAENKLDVKMLQRPQTMLKTFDDLHSMLTTRLSSGAITADQHDALQSILSALWFCATSERGNLYLPAATPESLALAKDSGMLNAAIQEIQKVRTPGASMNISYPDTLGTPGEPSLPAGIQAIVELCSWPVTSDLIETVTSADVSEIDEEGEESAIEEDPQQQIRAALQPLLHANLGEVYNAIAEYLPDDHLAALKRLLDGLESAVVAGAVKLDLSEVNEVVLNMLAGNDFFNHLADFAGSAGTGPVQVILPAGIETMNGLERKDNQLFLRGSSGAI